jgi:sulfatase modifying factor 1
MPKAPPPTECCCIRREVMADIFISYARGDRERIRPLADAFSEQGWTVFWDLEIPPGQSWRSYLKGRLDEARCVVVAWSETSVESHWVQVEADEGLRRGVLVPVCIDQTEPPFGFGHVQAADLSGWQGSPTSAVFAQTLRAVETILGPSQAMAFT